MGGEFNREQGALQWVRPADGKASARPRQAREEERPRQRSHRWRRHGRHAARRALGDRAIHLEERPQLPLKGKSEAVALFAPAST